jgi:hypothetical protein
MDTALTLADGDLVAVALASAIRSGDLPALGRLLNEHPGLANARLADGPGVARTSLHVAADWPGHFPNGSAVVAALVATEFGATPEDAPWAREIELRDPDGNRLRIGSPHPAGQR